MLGRKFFGMFDFSLARVVFQCRALSMPRALNAARFQCRARDVDSILAFKFNEGSVRDALLEKYDTIFECEGDNPRTAPSRHAHMVKYIIWFY